MTQKVQVLTEHAEKSYEEVTDVISKMWTGSDLEGELNISKMEALREYDAYLQALLVDACIKNGVFGQEQADIIGQTVRYGSMNEDIDITLFGDCNYEMRARLSEIAEEKLKTVPKCFIVAEVFDKKTGGNICKTLFDSLLQITFSVLSVSGNVDLKSVKHRLKPIVDFMVEKEIKIN